MSVKTTTFQTGHEELIHDAQLDYYGKRLATASSDRTIRIFDCSGGEHTLLSVIRGHEGPVWQVSWAHPKFGAILASCGYDGRVCVWKESANQWFKIHEKFYSDSSVNCLSWAPHTFGLCLAVGIADGNVAVLTHRDNNVWEVQEFPAHKGSVNGVSWGPDVKTGALLAPTTTMQPADGNPSPYRFERRLVSGGTDNCIRVWKYVDADGQWVDTEAIPSELQHSDWVRDVSWAPSIGLTSTTMASASADRNVMIWSEEGDGVWKRSAVLTFDAPVWRVSWSIMGGVLAVSEGDGKVSLWKENSENDWRKISTDASNNFQNQNSSPF